MNPKSNRISRPAALVLSRLVPAVALVWAAALRAEDATCQLTVHADQPGAVINPNIYGQFAEHLGHGIYGGIWVGEDSPIPNTRGMRNDVIDALRHLRVPILRWPGGCFADEYHWRDGIGPRSSRPKMINTNWGGVVEDNAFGTHEFLDFCELIGAEPYITGNLGSGTVQEMHDWVEYMTSDADSPMANLRRKNGRNEPWKIKYFAIGNENWGCGGDMTPEFYADQFRRYNAFIKNYPGNKVARIACGPSDDDYAWTDTVMKIAGKRADGLSLHHYTVMDGNWKQKGSATQFSEAEWFAMLSQTLKMDELITRHSGIMDHYDPEKKVGLMVDEWGAWYDVEPGTNPGFLYQQNSLRDAILAGMNLNIFHKHADRVQMSNIAQMINVLQSMILTDGPKMVLTPTYHVFAMYNVHQGAHMLPTDLAGPEYRFRGKAMPAISASASRDAQGRIHISFCNADPHAGVAVACRLVGVSPSKVTGTVLTADSIGAHNTFDRPGAVSPAAFTDFSREGDNLTVRLPAKSVTVVEID
jgi:alpha-N-arabinofuranosidase